MAYVAYQAYTSLHYQNPEQTVVNIKKGTSVKKIASILEENRVIENKIWFEVYLRISNQAHQLKAGEYEFKAGQDAFAVIDRMILGLVKTYKFTIPEGYNIHEVCTVFVENLLMSKEECEHEIRRTDLLKERDSIKTLEGYLFPDTYVYESDTPSSDFVKMAVALFYKKVGEERIQKAKQMGLSLHELITFASIVEKETGIPSERPLIASVFHNRLKKGMLLQTDPTVIYGVKNFDGNLRKRDLLTDTPYNTYMRPGLPVGPICNPGLDAIDAVLEPVDSDYLYFVAKGDGSHYFSKTIEQHNRAVRYYQLKQGSAP